MNYFSKTLLVGFVPIAVVMCLFLFFYLPSVYCTKHDILGLEVQLSEQMRMERIREKVVKLLVFTVFLLYPFVSRKLLTAFNCVTVEDVSYLVADMAVQCEGDQYWPYIPGIGVFCLMYPVGVPATCFGMIWSKRDKLNDPRILYMMGFLYDAYDSESWWWEVLDMTHKLTLTAIIPFCPPNVELPAACIILMIYLMCMLVKKPYVRKGDDRLHLLVQTELYLVALIAFTLSRPNVYEEAQRTGMDFVISILMILIICSLIISFLVIAGRNLYKMVIYRKHFAENQKQMIPVYR